MSVSSNARAERFWVKVSPTLSGCWLWTAGRTSGGYGMFYVGDRQVVYAHRFAYELLVGAITDGLQLDHLCRVRHCVNPAHLEPVTSAENSRRGFYARKTHCIHGHQYTSENTGRQAAGRYCLTCSRNRSRNRSLISGGRGL